MNVGGESSHRFRVVALSRDPVLAAHLRGLAPARAELIEVASGYEAAAELLAAPVAAMVMDLRAIGPAHRRLLEMARRMHVEMLGVGGLPTEMPLDALSRVRLLSCSDAAEALAALAEQWAVAAEPAAAPPTPVAAGPISAVEAPPAQAAAAQPAPAPPPRRRAAKRPRAVPKRAPAHVPRRGPRAQRSPAGHGEAGAAERADDDQDQPPSGAPTRTEPRDARHEEEAPAELSVAGGRDQAGSPAQRAQPNRSPRELLTPEELAALLEGEP